MLCPTILSVFESYNCFYCTVFLYYLSPLPVLIFEVNILLFLRTLIQKLQVFSVPILIPVGEQVPTFRRTVLSSSSGSINIVYHNWSTYMFFLYERDQV